LIIFDDKCYIHNFKCGGTSVKNAIIEQKTPSVIMSHIPTDFTPRGLETFTTIRDPRTWYKSVYFYERGWIERFFYEEGNDGKNLYNYIIGTRRRFFPPLWYLFFEDQNNPIMGKTKIVDYDTFLDNALNFKEYMSENDVFEEHINWKQSRHFPKFMAYNGRFEFKDTLFQEFHDKLSIQKCDRSFKLESELKSLAKYAGLRMIGEYNVTDYDRSIHRKRDIEEKDTRILDLYDYW